MRLRDIGLLAILIGVLSPQVFYVTEATAQERVVSDEMLKRRWPNGIIPFSFDPNFNGDKDEIRAAFFGSETVPGCSTAVPCIGWNAADAVRFIDCDATGDCDKYRHTVYLIAGDNMIDSNGDIVVDEKGNPKKYNGTRKKRGFGYLKAETPLKEGCTENTLNQDRNCRKEDCKFNSDQKCVFDVWLKNSTNFMWNAGHELGHMLGFQHEQRRYDRDTFIDTSNCSGQAWEDSIMNSENFIGSYDVQSIMHYPEKEGRCWTALPGKPVVTYRNNDLPSPKDLAKLQLLYGVRGDWRRNGKWCIRGGRILHTGDFNKDGQIDLLCHSAVSGFNATGRKWIDYANSDGHFNGTNWSSGTAKFCFGSKRRLHEGDFDGDGDTDVVCHNRGLGTISVDYTNSEGELNGQDWPENGVHPWQCKGETVRIYVGDFNGDGKDDLLCHDGQTGVRMIDLANTNGRFGTFDWKSEDLGRKSWCVGSGKRLILGNFDGDTSDDVLCHNTETGHRLIDYAFNHGNLKGTNWDSKGDSANAFCWGQDRKVHVADVNGDGADDLICHNSRIGSVSVDLADKGVSWREGSGLRGKDAFYDLAFCNAKDARLLTGAFGPNDTRADLLCHNSVTGHMAVLYARSGGTFEIPPGY